MRKFDFMSLGLCGQSVFLSVPHFHMPEETLHASSMFTEPGGKAYNQAVAGARLGARVCFAGAVGLDEEALACEARLYAEGVEKVSLIKKADVRTAYACILTDAQGENRVTVYPGASQTLSVQDVEAMEEDIKASCILLLTCEIPQAAFGRAVQLAKKHETKIIINPAPYYPWVEEYISEAWAITPNRNETDCLKTKAAICVTTLGKDGACLFRDGVYRTISTPSVKAIDTTGAGDAFNAGFALASARGCDIEDAVIFANRVASESVQYAHVLESYRFDGIRTFR